MGNVSFAILMSGHALLSKYVMNAILEVSREDARYVVDKGYQMHIIARNVYKWRRTEMGVQRL
jgi:hypothetical protein